MIFIFMYIDEIGKEIFDFLSLILRTIVFALYHNQSMKDAWVQAQVFDLKQINTRYHFTIFINCRNMF